MTSEQEVSTTSRTETVQPLQSADFEFLNLINKVNNMTINLEDKMYSKIVDLLSETFIIATRLINIGRCIQLTEDTDSYLNGVKNNIIQPFTSDMQGKMQKVLDSLNTGITLPTVDWKVKLYPSEWQDGVSFISLNSHHSELPLQCPRHINLVVQKDTISRANTVQWYDYSRRTQSLRCNGYRQHYSHLIGYVYNI